MQFPPPPFPGGLPPPPFPMPPGAFPGPVRELFSIFLFCLFVLKKKKKKKKSFLFLFLLLPEWRGCLRALLLPELVRASEPCRQAKILADLSFVATFLRLCQKDFCFTFSPLAVRLPRVASSRTSRASRQNTALLTIATIRLPLMRCRSDKERHFCCGPVVFHADRFFSGAERTSGVWIGPGHEMGYWSDCWWSHGWNAARYLFLHFARFCFGFMICFCARVSSNLCWKSESRN